MRGPVRLKLTLYPASQLLWPPTVPTPIASSSLGTRIHTRWAPRSMEENVHSENSICDVRRVWVRDIHERTPDASSPHKLTAAA